MTAWSSRLNKRLLIAVGIVGLAVAGWFWRTTDYGFVTGKEARRRLESYTWHAAPHRVRPVADPADAFLTRRKLIREAEDRIDIAVFLWRDDESSRVLFDDLLRACERGVRVRILGDGVFFLRELGRVKAMARAHENLEIRVYNPLDGQLASVDIRSLDDLGWSFDRTNHRFHIKLFTIDGTRTLVGGRNIGDRYFGFADDYNFIDLDLLVEGPAVQQAVEIFETYWEDRRTRGVLSLNDVAAADPEPRSAPDPIPGRYTEGNIDGEWRTVTRMALWADPPGTIDTVAGYQPDLLADRLAALAGAAERDLLVSTPYLVVSERSHDLLGRLREENGDLRLRFLTNSLAASDNWQTYGTFHAQLQWLLNDYRLWIHLKKPHSLREMAGGEESVSSLHTKAWVVDERWAAVGSFNWDPRSEIFNTEVMAVIDDSGFAQWLGRHLAPLAKPGNAWVVAERDLPVGLEQVDGLTNLFNAWSRELTGLQAWSISNTACFEQTGDRILAPWEEGFYDHYKPVGPFPEVKRSDAKRVNSALMRPISDLVKPAL